VTPGAPHLPPARRRKRSPLGYVVALVALVGVGGAFLYSNLSNSLVYFVTPGEYRADLAKYAGKTLRLGGLVKDAQYDAPSQRLAFTITDGTASYPVRYVGAVPNLFQANQGVVVEGQFQDGTFEASNLLVKHSEEYKAPHEQADIKRLLQDTK